MFRSSSTWPLLLAGLLAAGLSACTASHREPGCTSSNDCGSDQLCVDGNCLDMRTCSSDSDCSAPLARCRMATGECVQCLDDGDCTRVEHCVAYTCLEGCGSDGDCDEPTPFCDPEGQVCAECLTDAQCESGEICDQGACTQPPVCEQDDDCAAGEICVDGACHTGCNSSRDCPQGMSCVKEEGPYGTCAQCLADSDCPPGFACQDYACVFHCSSDAHCVPQVCDLASGQCVACNQDSDCRAGEVCALHACTAGCNDDGDCATGRCDPASQQCVECLIIDDCPLGHICQDRECITGCSNDRDCPAGLLCDPDQGQFGACVECLADGDCPDDQVCSAGACTSACATDADCAPPQPRCDPVLGACVECLAKDDCQLGNLCVDQVCSPGCESERDCPDGDECVNGQCQGACVPTGDEVCDGADNDCDGRTDADDPQLVLAPCELTQGVCAGSRHTAVQCLAGSWQACTNLQYGPDFGPEVCDGLDTDCNGTGDEGLQLDCQAEYVCSGGQCVYSGGCTNDCAEGATDCTIWDSSIVYVCGNTDEDPCSEWVEQQCPPNSYCEGFVFNACICNDVECAGTCCATGEVCNNGACCEPTCPARTCGSDGCGGTCECNLPNDQCISAVCTCSPSCAGKACGDDGCGGACPDTCSAGTHCEGNHCVCDYAECQAQCCQDGQVCSVYTGGCCDPQCAGVACGPDGCGHSCGTCADNEACIDGECVCQPYCGVNQCGDDGCGGSCGTCPSGQVCDGGSCCTPQCSGRACGPDSCGGSCGYCGTNEECVDASGQCVCAYDECGQTCCDSGQSCYQGACCTPACGDGLSTPYHCQDDSCGGTCDCSQTYGDPATCGNDGLCVCSPPAFTCQTLFYGEMCCSSGQQCDFWLFGCY